MLDSNRVADSKSLFQVAAVFISALIIASVLPLLLQCAEVLLLRVPSAKQSAIAQALAALAQQSERRCGETPYAARNYRRNIITCNYA